LILILIFAISANIALVEKIGKEEKKRKKKQGKKDKTKTKEKDLPSTSVKPYLTKDALVS